MGRFVFLAILQKVPKDFVQEGDWDCFMLCFWAVVFDVLLQCSLSTMPIVPVVVFMIVGNITPTKSVSVEAEPGCTRVLLNTGSTGISRRHAESLETFAGPWVIDIEMPKQM